MIPASFKRPFKKLSEKWRGFLLSQDIRSDQEFLPAALSIMETPASPVRMSMIWVICALFVGALAWSYFSHIDILAVAQGKIQPNGRVKTIQPAAPGKISAIRVENGQIVEPGDVLIELDPAEANADQGEAAAQLMAYRAEQLRRADALEATQGDTIALGMKIAWPKDMPKEVRLREDRVLATDLAQLNSAVQANMAQMLQKKAERMRLEQTVSAQQRLIATLRERVKLRQTLFDKQFGTKTNLIDAKEALQFQEMNLASQQGQLMETAAAVQVLEHERAKLFQTFRSENSEKLAEAERNVETASQRSLKADARLQHMRLVSPIRGSVMGLSATTVGQVVNAGEEIMRIVPESASLEIEAYAENRDIGFIEPGQDATVKVDAFPFTRYGELNARVVKVARDAIPEPDAQTVEGNPSRSTKNTYFGGAQRMQNLVFPVTLAMTGKTIMVDGVATPLTPGMSVAVEIKTGRRRVIDYLFSPLRQTVSSALRER